jgi:hypothetical protein
VVLQTKILEKFYLCSGHGVPAKRGRESLTRANRAGGKKELETQRRPVQREGHYGSELWLQQIFALLGLESSLRPRGRQEKHSGALKKAPVLSSIQARGKRLPSPFPRRPLFLGIA